MITERKPTPSFSKLPTAEQLKAAIAKHKYTPKDFKHDTLANTCICPAGKELYSNGRKLYSQRMGTVGPVFGNLRYNKGLDRFTLRGLAKVDTQWHLFCLVHNIEKLAHCGYGVK